MEEDGGGGGDRSYRVEIERDSKDTKDTKIKCDPSKAVTTEGTTNCYA